MAVGKLSNPENPVASWQVGKLASWQVGKLASWQVASPESGPPVIVESRQVLPVGAVHLSLEQDPTRHQFPTPVIAKGKGNRALRNSPQTIPSRDSWHGCSTQSLASRLEPGSLGKVRETLKCLMPSHAPSLSVCDASQFLPHCSDWGAHGIFATIASGMGCFGIAGSVESG